MDFGGAGGPVYGQQGIADSGNTPGGRDSAASWVDSQGNLWLFGGYVPNEGFYNDLWFYTPSTGYWTWAGGPMGPGNLGTYGTQGVAAAGNVPDSRAISVSWTDSSGNFWLFGGLGTPQVSYQGILNDLWEYSPSSGLWTWQSGSNGSDAMGIYGSQGIPAVSNTPGSRYGAVSWIDSADNLWLFGGQCRWRPCRRLPIWPKRPLQ